MDMEIIVSQQQGHVPVTVFHVRGRINLGTVEQLLSQAQAAYQAGMRDLLIDLTEVSSLTSAGLRTIHQMYQLLRGDLPDEKDEATRTRPAEGMLKSPHLKLLGPSPHVRKVLETAGFDTFVEIHEDMQDAIASFG